MMVNGVRVHTLMQPVSKIATNCQVRSASNIYQRRTRLFQPWCFVEPSDSYTIQMTINLLHFIYFILWYNASLFYVCECICVFAWMFFSPPGYISRLGQARNIAWLDKYHNTNVIYFLVSDFKFYTMLFPCMWHRLCFFGFFMIIDFII